MDMLWASAACVLLACAGAASDANLAPNPSFEAGGAKPDGWEVWSYKDMRVWRDDTVARTGRASVAMDIGPEGAAEYPTCRLAIRPVAVGEVYEGSAWARTRGMTDIGGYVCLEAMSGKDRLGFVSSAFTMGGDHDWMRLTVRHAVPPGADMVWLTLVAHGRGKVWFDDAELHRVVEAPRDPYRGGEVALRLVLVPGGPGQTLLGFGAHGDFFLTRRVSTGRGVDDRDRDFVLARVRAMRPHIIRTLFDYKWWEPEEGRRTPDSEEMRDYVYWARFLKTIGASVILCPWGDYFAYPDWLRDGDRRLPPPAKREAMLRSLVDVLWFLRREQGLDNVRYLCLMNEPENDLLRGFPPEELVRLDRLLDQMLRDRGLRDEVTLLGVDECQAGPCEVSDWLRRVATLGTEWCDLLSVHTYRHRYVPGLEPWLRERLSLLRKAGPGGRDVPVLITECGDGGSTFDNPETAKYDYGLFLADFAVAALRGGASGALPWCLMDTYYTEDLAQHWGLWQYKDKGWAPRPGFYAWSLVTRYTRPGSKAVAVRALPAAVGVRAAALRAPGGELTVLVVNRYARPLRVALDLGAKRPPVLRVFRYTRQAVAAAGGGMLKPTRTLAARDYGRTAALELPAESFTLLTELGEE